MALSDCEKCWDTPCTCGWDYRKYSKERLQTFVEAVISMHPKETQIEIINKIKEKYEKD